MTRTTKILLILSASATVMGLAFVTGLINVSNAVAFYVALPLGAVFFGLFLIFRMLEKEASLYDDEQHSRAAFKEITTTKQKESGEIHRDHSAHTRQKASPAH